MSEENGSDHTIHFGFTVSLDRKLFFRRTYPSCGRDFKTEVAEADLASELQPTFGQVGLEIGGIDSEEPRGTGPQYISCPYCQFRAELSDTFTEEFILYVQRYIQREYLLPLLNQTLSDFADGFDNSRTRSGGLFSINMIFEYSRTILPPRPVSGPEPPDMTIIELLCCGTKIKVLDGYDLQYCPHCSTEVLLQ